jgi:transcriptional regulator with XRE-family HTH domain
MSDHGIPLSRRVDLLFECIPKANGQRFRYEDVKAIGGVDPAAVSRVRSGQILEPTMSSLAGLARTFGVSMDYFVIDGSEDELRRYLDNERTQADLDRMRSRQRVEADSQVQALAQRAAYLDDEGIQAIEGMINYVLRQKGIQVPDQSENK